MIDPHVISMAREMIVQDPESDSIYHLTSAFFCLVTELATRKHIEILKRASPPDLIIILLSRLFDNTSNRFSDLLNRLNFIRWMHQEFKIQKENEDQYWHLFAGLAIKDFHIDISSFMDSLAPVIIESTVGLKAKNKKPNRLPIFPDVQAESKRTYRERLPEDICQLIDSTEKWLTIVKETRNILAHREHLKIVYGNPNDGVLFQVYDPAGMSYMPKLKLDDQLLFGNSGEVVDFWKYTAFTFSELIVFLENLGIRLCEILEWDPAILTPYSHQFRCPNLVQALDELVGDKFSG